MLDYLLYKLTSRLLVNPLVTSYPQKTVNLEGSHHQYIAAPLFLKEVFTNYVKPGSFAPILMPKNHMYIKSLFCVQIKNSTLFLFSFLNK